MQRIMATALTPEDYIATEGHRQVRAELACPQCGCRRGLHRHGVYGRNLTGALGRVLRIWVARFRCVACRRTVSYLPDFALSYRLVQAATFEAYLERKLGRRDVQCWQGVLADYERRLRRHAMALWRVVGCGFGRAPPLKPAAVWPWLKGACGGLASAARRLVAQFSVTLFRRYQCHQPAMGKTARSARQIRQES